MSLLVAIGRWLTFRLLLWTWLLEVLGTILDGGIHYDTVTYTMIQWHIL